MDRLPPLDLLRGFVAVARRMSVTQAADDLHLTQSAVSRQLRALEEHLGLPLFLRKHRGLTLTSEGERLYRQADSWLQQIASEFASLRRSGTPAPVNISASVGATALWLLPRLGRFQQLHPEVDVRVSASNRVVDLERDGVDLALRYAPAARVPPGAMHLFGEAVLPVASPSLKLDPRFERNELPQLTLLEFEEVMSPWLRWGDWLRALGLERAKPRAHLILTQYDQVIYSALAGHGVALGRLPLVSSMLADGRLVVLRSTAPPEPPDYAYWLLQRPHNPNPAVARFVDWLRAEAADTSDAMAALLSPDPGPRSKGRKR
jgi:DNA-binding transcriptional LysR family regulator